MEDRFNFRAKSIKDNKWVYGNLVEIGKGISQSAIAFDYSGNEFSDTTYSIISKKIKQSNYYSNAEPCEIIIFEEHLIQENTLEQCTGCKDKNGKLIYEGDILLIKSDVYDTYYSKPTLKEYKHIVKWRENQTGFYPFCYGLHQEYESTTIEVIGNIHENKELIPND